MATGIGRAVVVAVASDARAVDDPFSTSSARTLFPAFSDESHTLDRWRSSVDGGFGGLCATSLTKVRTTKRRLGMA